MIENGYKYNPKYHFSMEICTFAHLKSNENKRSNNQLVDKLTLNKIFILFDFDIPVSSLLIILVFTSLKNINFPPFTKNFISNFLYICIFTPIRMNPISKQN